jgi:hypothetical protein
MLLAVSVLAQNETSNKGSSALVQGASASSQHEPFLIAANSLSVLPDAPSAGSVKFLPALNAAIASSASQAPIPAARVPLIERSVLDSRFLAVTGALFGSTVADIELTMRCRASGACSLVPDGLAERHKLYPITFGADGGITLLSYYLKSHHRRWWFVPAAAIIAGNAVYSVHAAKYIK